jgi:hypothetical protein
MSHQDANAEDLADIVCGSSWRVVLAWMLLALPPATIGCGIDARVSRDTGATTRVCRADCGGERAMGHTVSLEFDGEEAVAQITRGSVRPPRHDDFLQLAR